MVHTEEYKGHTINIDYDSSECHNPRDNDNLGTMVCYHSRHNLGDDHTKDNALDTVYRAKYAGHRNRLLTTLEPVIALPVYLYDHGGLSVSTTSFIGRAHQAEWDSGRVGWIYVTKSNLREELSAQRLSKKNIKWALEHLKAEVEEYDSYLRGEVYFFQVLDEDGEVVESCGGFIGDYEEGCLLDAREAVDWDIAYRGEKNAKEETGLGSPPWTTA